MPSRHIKAVLCGPPIFGISLVIGLDLCLLVSSDSKVYPMERNMDRLPLTQR